MKHRLVEKVRKQLEEMDREKDQEEEANWKE